MFVMDAFTATAEEESKGAVIAKLLEYMKSCQVTKQWSGGSVVYHSTSVSVGVGYTVSVKSKPELVDDGLVGGGKLLFVQGCFLYKTFDIPKHSYFCYFYKQGVTKIQNLNICTSGHHAD